MRVVCWNLFHGRAVPPAGRPLLREFGAALAGWSWDVALLQEVPPWWPPLLARACDADHRSVLTSRNALLPVRRAVASRRPDRLKSNGGGADAILVRGPLRIDAHARRRLRVWPERRMVHAVRLVVPGTGSGSAGSASAESRSAAVTNHSRLAGFDGAWIGNLHAEPPPEGAAGGSADAAAAFAAIARWAAASRIAGRPAGPDAAGTAVGSAVRADSTGAPLVLGGDFNLRPGPLDAALPRGWSRVASRDVDHVAVLGARADGPAALPARLLVGGGLLSDHPPLAVDLVADAANTG